MPETVPQAVDIGVPDLAIFPGDHLCAVYRGVEQRDKILLPFLEAGLRAGDKCICVVDTADPSEVLTALSGRIDARQPADSRQLDIIRASDLYLRSGNFCPKEIISSWKAAMSEAMYDGRFDLVRVVKSWSMLDVTPEPPALLALESEMNRFLPLFPQVILCLYDLERFGAGIVIDLVTTHRKLLLEGMVYENPYFMTPDELLVAASGDNGRVISDGMRELADRVAS
jgi:MEDS: MEthanogen/methylotroph, DcmR Sensory domain